MEKEEVEEEKESGQRGREKGDKIRNLFPLELFTHTAKLRITHTLKPIHRRNGTHLPI